MRHVGVGLAVVFTACAAGAADPVLPAPRPDPTAPLPRAELDKRLRRIAYDAASAGTDLFNSGNHESCYRLFEGTLMAAIPLLDHKPELAKSLREKLDRARREGRPADQAFILREGLDELLGVGKPAGQKTLWDRLGGEAAVKAVVHDFVLTAAADPRVNLTRGGAFKADDAAIARLEKMLVEQISAVTGGPFKYIGRDMKAVHAGMKITRDEFAALAEDLAATLRKFKVPPAEVNELMTIVGSTKDDIVEPQR